MQFNWEEFMDKNNKIAVHCKTEEEAIDFCRQMDAHGTWNVYAKSRRRLF